MLVPLVTPLGERFGINPVQLGIIFLANLELGYLTPPIGMNFLLIGVSFQAAHDDGLSRHAPGVSHPDGWSLADYLCARTNAVAGTVAGAITCVNPNPLSGWGML